MKKDKVRLQEAPPTTEKQVLSFKTFENQSKCPPHKEAKTGQLTSAGEVFCENSSLEGSTFIVALWTRSNPFPITTIFRPPL